MALAGGTEAAEQVDLKLRRFAEFVGRRAAYDRKTCEVPVGYAPARQRMGGSHQDRQLDPAEVVERYVELVEADTTELINFIPPDIIERLAARR